MRGMAYAQQAGILSPWVGLAMLVLLSLLCVLWIWALTEEPDDEERTHPLYDWKEDGL